MKEIQLEELARLLSAGLEEKVQFSGDVSVYNDRKAATTLFLRYRGDVSLFAGFDTIEVEELTLAMNGVNFYFKLRAPVDYQPQSTLSDCGGIQAYQQELIIPIDATPTAIMKLENIKNIVY